MFFGRGQCRQESIYIIIIIIIIITLYNNLGDNLSMLLLMNST